MRAWKTITVIILLIMTLGTIILIAGKMTGLLNWQWVWILAPAWIPAAGILVILPIPMLIMAVQSRLEQRKRRKWH